MSPVDSPQSISQIELIFGQSVQINQDQNWIYRNHFIFTGLMMRLMDEMLWKWDFRKLNELTNIAEGSLKCGDLRKHSKTHSGKKSSKSSGRFSYVAIWGNTHMKTYIYETYMKTRSGEKSSESRGRFCSAASSSENGWDALEMWLLQSDQLFLHLNLQQ